jgi:gliding motility-associated-like protein
MDLSYVFNTPGLQNISLITTDSFSAAVQCDDTITLSFFVHDLPVFTYLADTIQCEDVGFVINGFPTVSTNEPLSYAWEVDGILDDTTINLNTVIANPGIHPITYTVTSAFGCETDTTFDMYVMATPLPPVLSFNIPECPGDPFFLTATGEPNSTIAWSGPNNFNSNLFNVTFPLGVDGMGIYTAFLTSEYGCISDTTQIDATITYILSFDDFDFPNVISANEDNTNDFLDLKSYFQTCDEFTLYIFNRWGNMVWEQSQDSPFFRGVDKGGKELESGVYTYKLVFENFEKQGFIHVVR